MSRAFSHQNQSNRFNYGLDEGNNTHSPKEKMHEDEKKNEQEKKKNKKNEMLTVIKI